MLPPPESSLVRLNEQLEFADDEDVSLLQDGDELEASFVIIYMYIYIYIYIYSNQSYSYVSINAFSYIYIYIYLYVILPIHIYTAHTPGGIAKHATVVRR